MEETKARQLSAKIEAYRLEIAKDPEAFRNFLFRTGIIGSDNELTDNFKNLSIA